MLVARPLMPSDTQLSIAGHSCRHQFRFYNFFGIAPRSASYGASCPAAPPPPPTKKDIPSMSLRLSSDQSLQFHVPPAPPPDPISITHPRRSILAQSQLQHLRTPPNNGEDHLLQGHASYVLTFSAPLILHPLLIPHSASFQSNSFQTTNSLPAAGPYSQAIKTPGMIFVSGQIPATASGDLVQGSIAEQTAACCEAVAAILKEAGSSIEKVVKVLFPSSHHRVQRVMRLVC